MMLGPGDLYRQNWGKAKGEAENTLPCAIVDGPPSPCGLWRGSLRQALQKLTLNAPLPSWLAEP